LAPLPLKRTSLMIASDLLNSGARPNSPANDDSVGPQTLGLPISAVRMRAMTPLPPRVGPTISNIFCRLVRPEMT
jgi:hypothetical protein